MASKLAEVDVSFLALVFVFPCRCPEFFLMVLGSVVALDAAYLEAVRIFFKSLAAAKTCHDVVISNCDIILVGAARAARNRMTMRAFSWML